MGRETSITVEQVSTVASRLQSAGDKPTARAVRAALGAGSMATIVKHLQVWRADQKPHAEAAITLPVGVQRTLMEFVAGEVSAAREEVVAELEDTRQANADLILEVDKQREEIAHLEQAISVVQNERSMHAGRCQQLELDVAQLRDAVQAGRGELDKALAENARSAIRLEQVPRLESELEKLRTSFEAEHVARIAAEQAAAVAIARLEVLEQRVAELLARHSSNP